MVPCSRSRVMSRSTSAASCMPSEAVGSSSSSSRGLWAIARATATICRWPPDSALIGSVVSRTGMPSFANSRPASLCSATSENMCRRCSLPSITFDATSRFSVRARSCQTILTPSLAAAAGTGATGRPPTRIEPETGARSPATARISVVFPAPFSPGQRHHLARPHRQVDVGQRGDRAEPDRERGHGQLRRRHRPIVLRPNRHGSILIRGGDYYHPRSNSDFPERTLVPPPAAGSEPGTGAGRASPRRGRPAAPARPAAARRGPRSRR